MKVQMIKLAGGVLAPASDMEAEKLTKLKTGGIYPAEIKQQRNPKFHGKVFAFFNYCFEFWNGGQDLQFTCERKQYDRFRKDLTILAGYYDKTFRLNGDIRLEAQSLSFGNMAQDEFERCYTALINAACKHIFKGMDDKFYYEKLASFF